MKTPLLVSALLGGITLLEIGRIDSALIAVAAGLLIGWLADLAAHYLSAAWIR